MYIGNLESYQGVDLLIRGFARSDGPGRLVIIGGVQAHIDALRGLADELGAGDRVSFLGRVRSSGSVTTCRGPISWCLPARRGATRR